MNTSTKHIANCSLAVWSFQGNSGAPGPEGPEGHGSRDENEKAEKGIYRAYPISAFREVV